MTGWKLPIALLALAGTAANAAETGCVPAADAQALATVLLPDAVSAVAGRCATALPPAAMLRSGVAPLVARWRTEGAGDTAAASAAIGRFVGGDAPAVLTVVRSAMVDAMVKDIKPESCADIDQVLRLVAPLPAHNIAGLFVLLAQAGGAGKQASELPICKARP